jgi:hypothetical protein
LVLFSSGNVLGNYDDENSSYIAVQHDHIAYRMFKIDWWIINKSLI